MTVDFSVTNRHELSGILYLLAPAGSIRPVDESSGYNAVGGPIFLRDPRNLHGPLHLYWLRSTSTYDRRTGRLESQVMVEEAGAARPVWIPLRLGEWVEGMTGYPGGLGVTLSLYQDTDSPRRFDIVKKSGVLDSTSVASWGELSSKAFTDSNLNVVWLSPTEFVVPVADANSPHTVTLRVYHTGTCQPGRVGYRGNDFDAGTIDGQWSGPLIPAGPDRVLAVTRADFLLARHHRGRAFWSAIDLRTGVVTHTLIPWQRGSWSWVSPSRPQERSAAFC